MQGKRVHSICWFMKVCSKVTCSEDNGIIRAMKLIHNIVEHGKCFQVNDCLQMLECLDN